MPILSSKVLIVTELKVFYNHFTHRICIKKYIYIYNQFCYSKFCYYFVELSAERANCCLFEHRGKRKF